MLNIAKTRAIKLHNSEMNPVLKGSVFSASAVLIFAFLMEFMPIILLYLMIRSEKMGELIYEMKEGARYICHSNMNRILKIIIIAAGIAAAIMILSEAIPILIIYLIIWGIIDSDDDGNFWFWMFWISRIR